MARCQCGGGDCNCVVVAGDNTTVTGSGSTLNPFAVSAVTNCAEVRACLSNARGISYSATTGQISVDLSEDPGNNLVVRPNGLYVPTGAATVTTGCGLTGNGSASSPVAARTQTWSYACPVNTAGGGVYCDGNGVLRSDPPARMNTYTASMNQTYNDLAVPATDTTVASLSLTLQNTDTCRPAIAMVWQDVDADVFLPSAGNGSGAAYGISGDDMFAMQNHGDAPLNAVHAQVGKLINVNVPAGGSATTVLNITMGRGFGGATYSRIQARQQAWVFSLPN
ncbi:hypothetical protein ABTX60_07365 [Streptomyces sp. NPDC126510]|uniref:hypothetical protein n=1 Tax=Streptomyces sp. NPDC126510 TaxID=3155317 RepID=UPI00331A499C